MGLLLYNAIQSLFFFPSWLISLLLLIVFPMQLCPLLMFLIYFCDLVILFLLLCSEFSTFDNKICIIQCLKFPVFLKKHHNYWASIWKPGLWGNELISSLFSAKWWVILTSIVFECQCSKNPVSLYLHIFVLFCDFLCLPMHIYLNFET